MPFDGLTHTRGFRRSVRRIFKIPERCPFLDPREQLVPAFRPEFAGRAVARELLRALCIARGQQKHGEPLIVFAGDVDQFALVEMRHFNTVKRAFERGLRQGIIAVLERGFPCDIKGFALEPGAQFLS